MNEVISLQQGSKRKISKVSKKKASDPYFPAICRAGEIPETDDSKLVDKCVTIPGGGSVIT